MCRARTDRSHGGKEIDPMMPSVLRIALRSATTVFVLLLLVNAYSLDVQADYLITNGYHPRSPLVFGPDGSLYGTTMMGGAEVRGGRETDGTGTVFKVTVNGTLSTLLRFDELRRRHYFLGKTTFQFAGLSIGKDGSLYGTTVEGGTDGNGTVFRITPGGSA